MRYRCFYITDADHIVAMRKQRNETVDPRARKKIDATLSLMSGGIDSYKAVEVGSDSFELVASSSDKRKKIGSWMEQSLVRLSNGDDYLSIAVFDTDTTPPTLVHDTVRMGELQKFKALLPPLWINKYGSVVNDKGEIVMRGENEPKAIFFDGVSSYMDVSSCTGDFSTVTIVPNFWKKMKP